MPLVHWCQTGGPNSRRPLSCSSLLRAEGHLVLFCRNHSRSNGMRNAPCACKPPNWRQGHPVPTSASQPSNSVPQRSCSEQGNAFKRLEIGCFLQTSYPYCLLFLAKKSLSIDKIVVIWIGDVAVPQLHKQQVSSNFCFYTTSRIPS